MGIPCYHIIKDRIAQNQILYQHDFHPRWFFIRPPEDFIQIAPRPILNPITIRTKGRPRGSKNRQPESSTVRDASQFEKSLSGSSAMAKGTPATKPRKRTRTGRYRESKNRSPEPTESSSDYCDSLEDELMHQEVARLFKSHGNAPPLWTEEPDLAGMTRATRAYALRAREKEV